MRATTASRRIFVFGEATLKPVGRSHLIVDKPAVTSVKSNLG